MHTKFEKINAMKNSKYIGVDIRKFGGKGTTENSKGEGGGVEKIL